MRATLPVRVLARCFLSSGLSAEAFTQAAERALGRHFSWIAPLGRRMVRQFAGGTRPRERDVVRYLMRFHRFRGRTSRIKIASAITGAQGMQPVPAAESWNVPAIGTLRELAEWLDVTLPELEWFADLKGLNSQPGGNALSHYHLRPMLKRNGALRLIETPKPRLKAMQRRILHEILDRVPPHEAVHGFVRGRSIKSFAGAHCGRAVVLRMDFEDFFPSFSRGRIQSFFRTVGYPEAVADRLGGLCSSVVPGSSELYARPHLPQGAPTSPALANVCCYRLDCRLRGLAASAGAEYGRYADDLAFSGDREFRRHIENFAAHVAVIAAEEGLRVNHRKTRIMRAGVRQRLTGLICNSNPNILRAEFDCLKATLYNCVRHGPESQNRDSHPAFRQHLEGRLAYCEMINAAKAQRLRRLFEQVSWR